MYIIFLLEKGVVFMKKIKFILSFGILLMFLFSGCGTSNPTETEDITLKSLTLGTTTGSATLGGTFTLPIKGTAVYSDSSSKSVTLTWDKEVSTITAGITTYTASYTESGVTVKATFKLNVVSSEDTGYKIKIEDVTASVNGTVEVTCSASGFVDKITGMDLRVKIDNSYLEFLSGEFLGNLSGGLTIVKPSLTDSSIIIGATVVTEGADLSGEFFKFKFKALKSGTTNISINFIDVSNSLDSTVSGIDISDTATVTIN